MVQKPAPAPPQPITELPRFKVQEQLGKTLYQIRPDIYHPPTRLTTLPDQSKAYLDPDSKAENRKRKARERYHHNKARKKSKFIDDSAVESDGEGGDISSNHTSPEVSALEFPNSLPLQFVLCDLCNLKLSGEKQLSKHRNSHKCRFAKTTSSVTSVPRVTELSALTTT